ncbi:hypothetical protein [Polynucleobacter brandtiae]|uniref:hypothetical protein n=1 Tax=Polynucleobacter brandtiae TaxID=1938816 RepID=UPI001E50C7BD|nr:hypothetical protein [Polynucleobacter brandtiae]
MQPMIILTRAIANTLRARVCLLQAKSVLLLNNLDIKIMIANVLDEYPMILFVLEGGLALALLLFIVLWTGKGKK